MRSASHGAGKAVGANLQIARAQRELVHLVRQIEKTVVIAVVANGILSHRSFLKIFVLTASDRGTPVSGLRVHRVEARRRFGQQWRQWRRRARAESSARTHRAK